jgi:pyruvate kinase
MFPIESVQMMAKIAEVAEASGRHGDRTAVPRLAAVARQGVPQAMSAAACAIVNVLPVRAVVAFTMSGTTAQLVSNLRPTVPIMAFTPSEEVFNRLSLIRGVTPLMCEYIDRLDTLGTRVEQILAARGFAQPGDAVVVTGGHPIAARGSTNFVKVLQIPE